MRSLRIVEASPLLDEHLRFFKRGEDFHVQTLIPEFAVEGFYVAVLPGASRLYEECLDPQPT